MSDELNPYQPPESNPGDALSPGPVPEGFEYRPWSRGRVYVAFILGLHAAGFMMVFVHPVFAIMGLAFGIPALIIANKEIDEFPQSADHPFIRWGKIGGKIGLIGGPIVIVVWIVIIAVGVGLSI